MPRKFGDVVKERRSMPQRIDGGRSKSRTQAVEFGFVEDISSLAPK